MYWLRDARGHEYLLGAWWDKVTRRPLGDWHLIDLVPFFCFYFIVRLVSLAVTYFHEEAPRPAGQAQATQPSGQAQTGQSSEPAQEK